MQSPKHCYQLSSATFLGWAQKNPKILGERTPRTRGLEKLSLLQSPHFTYKETEGCSRHLPKEAWLLVAWGLVVGSHTEPQQEMEAQHTVSLRPGGLTFSEEASLS